MTAKRQEPADDQAAWAAAWLDGVASGASTMSQRRLSSIEARGSGLAAVRRLARARGVHLLRLTGDRGDELVAASRHAFDVIR